MENNLEKVRQEEYQLLKIATKNPAFDFLNDPGEDIYTLEDGEPFNDPGLAHSSEGDLDGFLTDPEEDIYTLEDGELFHD